MRSGPIQVPRPHPRTAGGERKPTLLIAGATGALGNEVLRRLVGLQRFESTQVLAREPVRAGMRGVTLDVVASGSPAGWLPARADVGVILFDPSSEQPVRAAKVAEFLALALQLAPGGIHIAAPEVVWRAAQGDMLATARQWLRS